MDVRLMSYQSAICTSLGPSLSFCTCGKSFNCVSFSFLVGKQGEEKRYLIVGGSFAQVIARFGPAVVDFNLLVENLFLFFPPNRL
jgi:hypothetical protein